MLFNPDVEKILKRPRIEKPQEEFILDNPPIQLPTEIAQEDLLKSIESRPLALIEDLNAEAGIVQDLIDLLVDTAPDISIEVPEEDQQFIGTKISTQDYLKALDDIDNGVNEHPARRIVEHFEWGVLQDNSPNNTNWMILPVVDFRQLRRDLVGAVGVLEGTLLASTNITTGGLSWSEDAISSHLNQVHRGLIQSSVDFRVKFFNVTRSIHIDLRSAFFNGLIGPITRVEEAKIRKVLLSLDSALNNIRTLLKTLNLVRSLEFVQVRDALASIIKKEIVKHLVSALSALINRMINRVVTPVLDLFTKGFEDSGPLGLIGDQLSTQIGGILADSIGILLDQYNGLAADLLRELDKESQSRLLKLQVLGERSVISRYIEHIDKARSLIDKALKELNLSKEVTDRLFGSITGKLAPPETPVIKKLEEREDYQAIATQPFQVRTETQPQEFEDFDENNSEDLFDPGEAPALDQIEAVEPGEPEEDDFSDV